MCEYYKSIIVSVKRMIIYARQAELTIIRYDFKLNWYTNSIAYLFLCLKTISSAATYTNQYTITHVFYRLRC